MTMENSRYKFRAWDMNLKKFHYPDLWDSSMPSNWRDWYVLQQFIGLLDKNGNEIYEGDILAQTKYKDEPKEYCQVVFENGSYRKKYKEWDKTLPYSIIDKSGLELLDYIVFGNICENPELLEE